MHAFRDGSAHSRQRDTFRFRRGRGAFRVGFHIFLDDPSSRARALHARQIHGQFPCQPSCRRGGRWRRRRSLSLRASRPDIGLDDPSARARAGEPLQIHAQFPGKPPRPGRRAHPVAAPRRLHGAPVVTRRLCRLLDGNGFGRYRLVRQSGDIVGYLLPLGKDETDHSTRLHHDTRRRDMFDDPARFGFHVHVYLFGLQRIKRLAPVNGSPVFHIPRRDHALGHGHSNFDQINLSRHV